MNMIRNIFSFLISELNLQRGDVSAVQRLYFENLCK